MEYDSFEGAFDQLKNIIRKFEEKDDIPIDELLKNYEEGMKAYSFCAKKLEDTQKKLKIIDENFE
jgi:exodeoxyribonuclease VII small subunit